MADVKKQVQVGVTDFLEIFERERHGGQHGAGKVFDGEFETRILRAVRERDQGFGKAVGIIALGHEVRGGGTEQSGVFQMRDRRDRGRVVGHFRQETRLRASRQRRPCTKWRGRGLWHVVADRAFATTRANVNVGKSRIGNLRQGDFFRAGQCPIYMQRGAWWTPLHFIDAVLKTKPQAIFVWGFCVARAYIR